MSYSSYDTQPQAGGIPIPGHQFAIDNLGADHPVTQGLSFIDRHTLMSVMIAAVIGIIFFTVASDVITAGALGDLMSLGVLFSWFALITSLGIGALRMARKHSSSKSVSQSAQ
jgi:hypothetical protein